jgi:nucleotide-binding universal stress UspA family protein
MQAKKILFPTDFSHTGDAALALATVLARDTGAKLLIVHVEEPPVAYGGGELYYGIPNPATEDLQKMLDAVQPNDPHVPCERHLVTGDPATTIVKFAEEQGVDMIVMGTHGRTGLSRLLMGSVAESVVGRSKCPVLTLRQPAHKVEDAKKKS